MRSILLLISLLFLAATVAGGTNAGPFDRAKAAYMRGDYAEVIRIIEPLAKQGDPNAQFNLGIMYGNGEGVPQSEFEAQRWFRKAAKYGHVQSSADFASKKPNPNQIPGD